MSATNVCRACRYWVNDRAKSFGSCRRFPPVPVASTYTEQKGDCGDYHQEVNSNLFSAWPETDPTDWCGEFRPVEGKGV